MTPLVLTTQSRYSIHLGQPPERSSLLNFLTFLALGSTSGHLYFLYRAFSREDFYQFLTILGAVLVTFLTLLALCEDLRYRLRKKIKGLEAREIPAPQKLEETKALYNDENWPIALILLAPNLSALVSICILFYGQWSILYPFFIVLTCRSLAKRLKMYIAAVCEAMVEQKKESKILQEWEDFGDWIEGSKLPLQDPRSFVEAYQKYVSALKAETKSSE